MSDLPDRYVTALLDWLACAARGRDEPAASAAGALGDPVVFAGTAGHVLDFDDTYLPGIAHLSAPTAPAALVVAAERGLGVAEALEAYARGFEAMGALARASHPALYDGGWHPTAVCGGVGAAVAAAALIGAPREHAVAIALLRPGGLRAAFGSDGKSLQVGLAAASGVRAARLAAAGARVPLAAAIAGFEQATGGSYAEPGPEAGAARGLEPGPKAGAARGLEPGPEAGAERGREPGPEAGPERGREPAPARLAVTENWIKPWPCCLQTHGAIEAAESVREAEGVDSATPDGPLTVTVHPVSLQAADQGPDPADGLQAKFSIPYLTAYTLLHGPPDVDSFRSVDRAATERARQIEVRTDAGQLESEFAIHAGERELARVTAARGSPERPLDATALRAKVESLAGPEVADALTDLKRPAADLLELVGLA